MQNEVHYASIIIDDPLLRENYGFLNYRILLRLMDKHNFHTTIAFIPWNYNRTDEKIAALFRERPDRFSLCVHGCDHTKGEFGNTDHNYLANKVKLATARMIEHENNTGVHFDRVMVFPQGIFSNEAMEALKKNNYLAAVNTEALPVNGPISSDFPFFLRYTPEDVIGLTSDPTFVVLHHGYFKHGYERLTAFVDGFNARSKNIKWDSVGNIIRHYVSTNKVHLHDPIDVDLSGLNVNGYKENVKIFMRRYASEFRDNYLSKNDFLFNCVKKVKTLMPLGSQI
jgi:peptidoglycan/xylan/chitin deacetylase (PgdA/CDA1 family)